MNGPVNRLLPASQTFLVSLGFRAACIRAAVPVATLCGLILLGAHPADFSLNPGAWAFARRIVMWTEGMDGSTAGGDPLRTYGLKCALPSGSWASYAPPRPTRLPPDGLDTEPPRSKLAYINTGFENASPLQWPMDANGTVQVFRLYNYERNSPNRAADHRHFQLQGEPGSDLTLILHNFDNVYNGKAEAFDPAGRSQRNVTGNSYHLKFGEKVVQIEPATPTPRTVLLRVLTAVDADEEEPPKAVYRLMAGGRLEVTAEGESTTLSAPEWITP